MSDAPRELRYVRATRVLHVVFADGATCDLPAEYLRVESPSAEVQGHGAEQKKIIAGRMHVGIIGIDPVGNYAVKITFDDLHDTGLYTWSYLRELADQHDTRWQDYLNALEMRGLSRGPVGRDQAR